MDSELMRIDLDHYDVNRFALRKFIEHNPNQTVRALTNEYSVVSNCPVVAATFYAMEVVGETPELVAMALRLIKFYDYEKITGCSFQIQNEELRQYTEQGVA
jgi:hypothetical protein